MEDFLRTHCDASGNLRPDLWRKAIEDVQRMAVKPWTRPGVSAAGATPKRIVGTQWMQIGPAPLRIEYHGYQGQGPDSGRVMDIAIDPRGSADQVIYIAASDGGIWKSTDGGASWAPKTDWMPSLLTCAVALDPGNPSVVYAGTGLGDGHFKGVGIYRSSDMGETWTQPAGNSVLENKAINRIVVPTPGVLLVGTSGGLYKSVDGGDTYGNDGPWFSNGKPVLAGSIDDVDLDTLTAGTVYACVDSLGLFKSTDYGSIFGGTSLFDANVPSVFQYLAFAQSRSPDNQTMYVSLQVQAKQAQVFKSVNGGGSWFELPNGSATSGESGGCQCAFDQTIGVDPLDANRVFLGFVELFESRNGGASFQNISGDWIHSDHHALVFSPHWPASAPTRAYFGTDGGISYTENDGASFANINEGIATSMFWQIDTGRGSDLNRAYTYGGSQDTGTCEHRPDFPGTDWHMAMGGDGFSAVVDPSNARRAYADVNGKFIVTGDGGSSWGSPQSGLPNGDGVPIGVDSNNSAIVYVRWGLNLYQSMDTASSFTLIRTFPANLWRWHPLATVALDSNTLWVSLMDNTLQRTANALSGTGATWTPITVNGAVPGLAITGVAIDPNNMAEAFVVYGGFSGISPANRTRHVFHTTDNGATWTDISGTDGGSPAQNLPDIPLHDLVIDPGTTPHTIIAATDCGVMASADMGATWYRLGVGLPNVECLSLAIEPSPSLLRVGTYGRSVFELGFGPAGYVWVDFGAPGPGVGTYEQPYNTLALGVSNVQTSGAILIKPGSSPETLTIAKPLTLHAVGGAATLGH